MRSELFGFYVLLVIGLAIMIGYFCLDRTRRRAYDRGLEDGQKKRNEQAFSQGFEQGYSAALHWSIATEIEVEAERRKIQRFEDGEMSA